jgi:type I restriction enzyme S subunit
MSNATIHIETEKQLVPAMRFNEFDGKWDLKRLASSIEIVAGYAFKSTEMENTPSTYQIIKMSNVYKSKLQLDRSPSYWEKIDKKQAKFLLRKKDILLTLTGTVGKKDYGYSIVIPENNKFLLNQRLVYLRYIENVSDGDFINNLIKTSRFFYFFFNESKGGTGNQTNVGIEDLKNIKLSFPTLPEQQKIASFLAAVDEKIQQLTKKKELLEHYKKGVMQQLFSGQLRFKDENGKDYPDWEEKRLGEITKYTKGFAFKSADYQDSGVRIVRVSDLLVTSLKKDNEKVFLSSEKASDYSKYQLIQGNIILTTVGSKPEMIESAVGRGIYINNKNEGLLNQNMLKFENIEGVSNRFVIGLINSKRYQHYMKGIARGNANQANITVVDLLQYKVPLPSLQEQQKIPTYLSGIDKKIEAVNNKITQTQTFKKWLLQQLFV